MTDIIARKQFAPLYIWLDIAFLIVFLGLLLWRKKYMTVAVGTLVQFGWEAGLLLGGIRSAGFETMGAKLQTLVVNSLLETNLGMPYAYCIFVAYSAKFTEQMRPREDRLTFTERIRENNREKVRQPKEKV